MMFKSIIPLAVLPMLAFAQPAEARDLFWWQLNDQPSSYDPQFDPQFDSADPYVDSQPDDQAAQDMFNQREYELYKRETRRRNGQDANYDPQFGYPDPPFYQAPPRVKHKKTVVAKFNAPHSTARVAAATPQTIAPATVKPAKAASLAGVSCGKGASIVSSFGFSDVTTKSCSGGTLVYGASRGGKSFEVQVSAASGELTAVKKL